MSEKKKEAGEAADNVVKVVDIPEEDQDEQSEPKQDNKDDSKQDENPKSLQEKESEPKQDNKDDSKQDENPKSLQEKETEPKQDNKTDSNRKGSSKKGKSKGKNNRGKRDPAEPIPINYRWLSATNKGNALINRFAEREKEVNNPDLIVHRLVALWIDHPNLQSKIPNYMVSYQYNNMTSIWNAYFNHLVKYPLALKMVEDEFNIYLQGKYTTDEYLTNLSACFPQFELKLIRNSGARGTVKGNILKNLAGKSEYENIIPMEKFNDIMLSFGNDFGLLYSYHYKAYFGTVPEVKGGEEMSVKDEDEKKKPASKETNVKKQEEPKKSKSKSPDIETPMKSSDMILNSLLSDQDSMVEAEDLGEYSSFYPPDTNEEKGKNEHEKSNISEASQSEASSESQSESESKPESESKKKLFSTTNMLIAGGVLLAGVAIVYLLKSKKSAATPAPVAYSQSIPVQSTRAPQAAVPNTQPYTPPHDKAPSAESARASTDSYRDFLTGGSLHSKLPPTIQRQRAAE